MLDRVVRRVRGRTLRWLRKHALLDERPVEERSNERTEGGALDACADIALRGGAFASLDRRGSAPVDDSNARFESKKRGPFTAEFDGFNVQAAVRIEADAGRGERVPAMSASTTTPSCLEPAGIAQKQMARSQGAGPPCASKAWEGAGMTPGVRDIHRGIEATECREAVRSSNMRTRHAAMLVVLGVVGSAACSGGASGSRASTPEVDPACRGLQGPDAALCAVEAALARQPRNECIGAQLREMQRMAWAYRQALARAAAAAAQRATFEGLAGARPAPSDTPTEGAQPGGRAPDGTYTVRLDVLVRVAVENARDEERRSKMWAALVADAISERAGAAARCPASGGADGGVP